MTDQNPLMQLQAVGEVGRPRSLFLYGNSSSDNEPYSKAEIVGTEVACNGVLHKIGSPLFPSDKSVSLDLGKYLEALVYWGVDDTRVPDTLTAKVIMDGIQAATPSAAPARAPAAQPAVVAPAVVPAEEDTLSSSSSQVGGRRSRWVVHPLGGFLIMKVGKLLARCKVHGLAQQH